MSMNIHKKNEIYKQDSLLCELKKILQWFGNHCKHLFKLNSKEQRVKLINIDLFYDMLFNCCYADFLCIFKIFKECKFIEADIFRKIFQLYLHKRFKHHNNKIFLIVMPAVAENYNTINRVKLLNFCLYMAYDIILRDYINGDLDQYVYDRVVLIKYIIGIWKNVGISANEYFHVAYDIYIRFKNHYCIKSHYENCLLLNHIIQLLEPTIHN